MEGLISVPRSIWQSITFIFPFSSHRKTTQRIFPPIETFSWLFCFAFRFPADRLTIFFRVFAVPDQRNPERKRGFRASIMSLCENAAASDRKLTSIFLSVSSDGNARKIRSVNCACAKERVKAWRTSNAFKTSFCQHRETNFRSLQNSTPSLTEFPTLDTWPHLDNCRVRRSSLVEKSDVFVSIFPLVSAADNAGIKVERTRTRENGERESKIIWRNSSSQGDTDVRWPEEWPDHSLQIILELNIIFGIGWDGFGSMFFTW